MQVAHLVQQRGNSELDMPLRDFLDSLNTPAYLHPNLVYFKLNFLPPSTYDLHLTFFSPPYSKHHFLLSGLLSENENVMPHVSMSNSNNISRSWEKLEQLALLNFLSHGILLAVEYPLTY